MNQNKLSVLVTFTEQVLGTLIGNKEIASDFIISKAKEEANKVEETEVMGAMEQLEKGTTYFPRDEKKLPFLWDYQFKGFLKEAIGVMTEMGNAGKLTKFTFKRAVDNAVFINPRRLYLRPSGDPTFVERPLRAETMQGDRVALARSEAFPAGTSFEAEIVTLVSGNEKSKLQSITPDLIREALAYGALKGIGQWRNSGVGRFEFKELSAK
jgi:hypothetical protein